MRRERLMPENEARQILVSGQFGIMSTLSPEGVPYGVPLNYYYDEDENAIFFHCALEGQKLNCIAANSRVSFTVVTKAEIDAPRLTTYYESAIATGIASMITGDDEKMKRLEGLCRALTPSFGANLCKSLSRTAVVRISIETLTGKRNAPR
jgi:nitroimidazol reductase NimA-like FMN-containing flavoprotein (pyridoxamine 5'-phosphate oxidase superfamily)